MQKERSQFYFFLISIRLKISTQRAIAKIFFVIFVVSKGENFGGHIKKRRYAYLVSREPRKFKDIAQGLHNRSHAYLRGLFIHIRAHRFS